MEEQFLDHIRRARLADPSQRILLAVSGGLDSMVMLHLFQAAGFQIGVAHVNFQLRGAESDGDEALVKDTCARLGIACFATCVETRAYAGAQQLSVQVAARELRYAWFKTVMEREHFSLLATAHHLNDRLETVLLNLARGSSLKGIPMRNGNIIRPLLPFSRQQLEDYARTRQLAWREDRSNAGDDYPRNYIRHHVVPLLRELNPRLEHGFARVIERLDATRELAAREAQRLQAKYVSTTGDRTSIQKLFAQAVDHPVPLLWQWISACGFNYDQAADIVAALPGESGRTFLSATHLLAVDRQDLVITPLAPMPAPVSIAAPGTQVVMGAWQLQVTHQAVPEVQADAYVAWLDAARLAFPLTWRPWREGDFFYPLGMEHRKKVSDFLIDRKVSVADKQLVTVVESGGEIVWVAGHRIDNRFKITASTREVVRLEVARRALRS